MAWHYIPFINHKADVEKFLLHLFILFPFLDILVQISTYRPIGKSPEKNRFLENLCYFARGRALGFQIFNE